MRKIWFEAKNVRPSTMVKRMFEHKRDVSEGSKSKIMAQRFILGKKVTFYENGLRVVDDKDLNEEDEYNSEILRLAHASLLINDAVGDKKSCYVDARKNPVEVIIYGEKAPVFIKKAAMLINNGELDCDFVLGSRLKETADGRNVKLA